MESRDINGITYDAPALDYNGESRPQGDDGKVDLGALESVFPNPNYIRRVQHGDNDPVSVYPNPCRDHLTILMRNNQPVRMVEVLGLDGRILRVVDNARCNPLTIDRGNLPSGLYLLRIRSQETYVRKVLIE